MEELIEEFRRFLQKERAAADNTISNYSSDLRQFLEEFCANHPRKPSLITVNPEILQDYQNWLKRKGFVSSTINRKFAALSSFFIWLKNKGIIKGNPVKGMYHYRPATIISQTLTIEQVNRLLEKPARSSRPGTIRDSAMLELLYATGLRISELVNLNLDKINLDPENPYIQVTHRGKWRKIPISPRSAQALSRYLEEVRPIWLSEKTENALFLNRRGERLTRQGFWLILKGYAEAAGFQKDQVSPQVLRNSFAAHRLEGGTPLKVLQILLGHAQPQTTSRFREELQSRS